MVYRMKYINSVCMYIYIYIYIYIYTEQKKKLPLTLLEKNLDENKLGE